jgi:hypothetical protein
MDKKSSNNSKSFYFQNDINKGMLLYKVTTFSFGICIGAMFFLLFFWWLPALIILAFDANIFNWIYSIKGFTISTVIIFILIWWSTFSDKKQEIKSDLKKVLSNSEILKWTQKCPVCKKGKLIKKEKRNFLGHIFFNFYCDNCDANFEQELTRFKLIPKETSEIDDTNIRNFYFQNSDKEKSIAEWYKLSHQKIEITKEIANVHISNKISNDNPVQGDITVTKNVQSFDDEISCPKCGSHQYFANKKGFSWGKAVGGAIVTGGVGGVLFGFHKSHKIRLSCLKCGYDWVAGKKK